MNAQPHLFFSRLPPLTDFVTVIAQVTTKGPHLLHTACCRALLRKNNKILASPAWEDNQHVYIAALKDVITEPAFRQSIPECNLKMVRGKYYAGKNCLFSNDWASCVNASLIVNNENVTLSVKGTLSKFLVARLSTFHICEDILDKFLKKEIRTITSRNMGDNSCLVLPSFKHASVHEISYDVPDFCPLSDASDMSTYWFDYHGFNIPCDNKIFVTLSFNFPNAPRMTYPYYCIRKGYPILKQSTQVLAIKEFVSNLNICFNEKILGLKLEFPTEAVFPTIPSDSMECVTVNTPSNLDTAPLAIPTENTSINLFTALKDVSSMKEMKITKESSAKITPRFTPYKRPTKHVTNSVVTESNNKTIKPNFQHLVKAPAPSWNFPTPTTSAHSIKPQFSQKQPDKPNFSHKPGPKAKRVPSPCQAKAKLPAKPSLRIPSSLKTPLKSPSLSQKNLKTPLKSPRFSQPTNYNSPSFSDEDDDFEAAMFSIGAALSPSTNKPTVNEIRFNKAKSSPAPKLMSAPATPLSKPKPTPSASPATPSTKARNKPVILTSDQVRAHFTQHCSLAKVNAQSLTAFLKVFKVKGLAKMKKQELTDEVVKLLVSGHEP